MLTLRTLTDGGQQAIEVAREVAGFVDAARESLDIALYDLKLGAETEPVVIGAIEGAVGRGIAVRLAVNADHRAPISVPPPPKCTPEEILSLKVPARCIAGIPDLMHHKYVVRDGESLLTGSSNWTDDSWSREENFFLTVDSPDLAHAYTLDFEQLWDTGDVSQSGNVEPRPVQVNGTEVRPWFTPGYGDELSHRIARLLARAKRRIRIASPVISAAPVLATLCQIVSDGHVDVAGVVDQTQIREVLRQWHGNQVARWKIPLLETVLERAPFSGKPSTPWGPGTVHDFMHAKVTIADDVVFAGSFNLSRSGERNAENVLEIRDPALAERLAGFVDGIRARYPAVSLP